MKVPENDIFMNVVNNDNEMYQVEWPKGQSEGSKIHRVSQAENYDDAALAVLDGLKRPITPSNTTSMVDDDTTTTDTSYNTNSQIHSVTQGQPLHQQFQPKYEATFLEDNDVWFYDREKGDDLGSSSLDMVNYKKKCCPLEARHATALLAACFTTTKDLLEQKQQEEKFELIEPVNDLGSDDDRGAVVRRGENRDVVVPTTSKDRERNESMEKELNLKKMSNFAFIEPDESCKTKSKTPVAAITSTPSSVTLQESNDEDVTSELSDEKTEKYFYDDDDDDTVSLAIIGTIMLGSDDSSEKEMIQHGYKIPKQDCTRIDAIDERVASFKEQNDYNQKERPPPSIDKVSNVRGTGRSIRQNDEKMAFPSTAQEGLESIEATHRLTGEPFLCHTMNSWLESDDYNEWLCRHSADNGMISTQNSMISGLNEMQERQLLNEPKSIGVEMALDHGEKRIKEKRRKRIKNYLKFLKCRKQVDTTTLSNLEAEFRASRGRSHRRHKSDYTGGSDMVKTTDRFNSVNDSTILGSNALLNGISSSSKVFVTPAKEVEYTTISNVAYEDFPNIHKAKNEGKFHDDVTEAVDNVNNQKNVGGSSSDSLGSIKYYDMDDDNDDDIDVHQSCQIPRLPSLEDLKSLPSLLTWIDLQGELPFHDNQPGHVASVQNKIHEYGEYLQTLSASLERKKHNNNNDRGAFVSTVESDDILAHALHYAERVELLDKSQHYVL